MIFYAMVGFFLGDHLASWNPDESYSNEDKHKAPTLLHIRPLSLQDGGGRFS